MSDVALSVEGLGKRYRIGAERSAAYGTLREVIAGALRKPYAWMSERRLGTNSTRDVWALRDVSFQVSPGEVLGIIGRNGAGKSTLLKLLSRITDPTEGRAIVRGRIGSLLEVGTGFHPELSGRDNVFLNGAILGMDRRSIAKRFEEIVEFAGVERHIDTPVKRYSSGMYMRLAFAVAAHLEPDILLLDEVLAVGDIDFQRKCVGTMRNVANRGRTVLVVSHNLGLVESLCSRCVWLDDGRVRADGSTTDVIAAYASQRRLRPAVRDLARTRLAVNKDSHAKFAQIRLLGSDGAEIQTLRMGEGLTLEMDIDVDQRVVYPWLGIHFRTASGQLVFRCANREAGFDLPALKGRSRVRCEIRDLNLLPGRYCIDVVLADMQHTRHDELQSVAEFDVEVADVFATGIPMDRDYGVVYFSSRWDLSLISSEGLDGGAGGSA